MAPPLTIIKLSAGIPFTVKSLAWRAAGPGGFRLTVKSVGGLKTVVPQFGLEVAQPGVGVRLGDAVGVAVGVETGHVGLGVTPGVGEPPRALKQKYSIELSGVTPSQA